MRDQKSFRISSIPETDPLLRSRISDALYSGQPQYAREPKTRGTGRNQYQNYEKQGLNKVKHYVKTKTCWGCGKTGQILSNCSESVVQNVAKRVQYYQKGPYKDQSKAAKCVLFELCQELDHEPTVSDCDKLQDAEDFFEDVVDNDQNEQDQNDGKNTEESDYMPEQLFSQLTEAPSTLPLSLGETEDF